MCSELHVRLVADAARTLDAALQLATCATPTCSCLVRVGESCHSSDDGAERSCDATADEVRAWPWLVPRDLLEWQGMLVDLKNHQTCPSAGWCGLALGCRRGYCGACTSDRDCGAGETCVLDHCLLEANVGCRGASECGTPGEAWCVMNGVTGGEARGNSRLLSACSDGFGPSPFPD